MAKDKSKKAKKQNKSPKEKPNQMVAIFSIGGAGTRYVRKSVHKALGKSFNGLIMHRHGPKIVSKKDRKLEANGQVKAVIIHNDPLLSFLSRVRRSSSLAGFLRGREIESVSETLKSIKLSINKISDLYDFSEKELNKYETDFVKYILDKNIQGEDAYGFVEHFDRMLTISNVIGKENCLYIDFRDPEAATKLSSFFGTPVEFVYDPSRRSSSADYLKQLYPEDWQKIIELYADIDKKCLEKIKQASN